MKRAWQIALLGVAVVFPLSAFAVESSRSALLERPQLEASLNLPLNQETPSSRRWSGSWWLGTEMQNFSEGKDEGTSVSVVIGSLFNYELAPWAQIKLDLEARFVSAHTQVRYDEDTQTNGVRLREGYLSFGNAEVFEARVGALSQRDLRAPLLVNSRRAFPGLREQLLVSGTESVRLQLWAQQTMPTSYSLNTMRAEREKTPTFLTETLNLKITPAKTVETEFYATHFRFDNLPAVVAFDSSALGNTVNGDVAANSDFKYGFDGFVLGTEFGLKPSGPLSFKLGGQWLQNTSAPEKSNRGQMMFLETQLRAGQTLLIRPRYVSFFNESDTSPAIYNRWQLGNNNRKGLMAQIEVEFIKYGFTVQAQYVQAAMINSDPFQFDKEVFTLGVETNNVSF